MKKHIKNVKKKEVGSGPPYGPPYRAWGEYNHEEKRLILAEVMERGNSNKTAAELLGTTRGTIAGFRRDHKISSKNEPPAFSLQRAKPQPKEAETKPPKTLPPPSSALAPSKAVTPEPGSALPGMVPKRPQTAYDLRRPISKAASEGPATHSRKLATTEASQCKHQNAEGLRCGYVRTPGSNYCTLHKN